MYIPYIALGLLLSLFLTYVAIIMLPHLGYIDVPHGRHQHEKPVPRGGGAAIWLSFFATAALLCISMQSTNPAYYVDIKTFLLKFLTPASIILIVGLIDDRFELPSWVKLLGQIAAATVIYLEGAGITNLFLIPLPAPLSFAATVFWCVIIINAYNLIDGLDGIAAGLAAISSFLLAVWMFMLGHSGGMVVILLIFCASCLGFLRYNFSPARIFMGDTGSMFLGLFFAYISMLYSTKHVTITSFLVPLAAIGVPIFDVFLAVWRRFFRRFIQKDPDSSIMRGDHDHLHHRIQKETGTTRKTAYIMYGLSISVCVLAIFATFFQSSIPALILLLCLMVFFVTIRYSGIELFDTLTSVAHGLKRPKRNFVISAMHPALDVVLLIIAFIISSRICKSFLTESSYLLWAISHIAPFVLVLCISGIYRTFWLRMGIIQYYRLIKLLGIAGIAGYICNSVFCIYSNVPKADMYKYGIFYMVYFLLLSLLILGERFLIHFYESFGYRRLFIRNQGKHSTLERVLVYGGGVQCRLYVARQFCNFDRKDNNVKIVGVMDDNKSLRGFNVYGFKVLGDLKHIENIFAKNPFDTVIVACDPPESRKETLRKFSSENKIKLRKTTYIEEEI